MRRHDTAHPTTHSPGVRAVPIVSASRPASSPFQEMKAAKQGNSIPELRSGRSRVRGREVSPAFNARRARRPGHLLKGHREGEQRCLPVWAMAFLGSRPRLPVQGLRPTRIAERGFSLWLSPRHRRVQQLPAGPQRRTPQCRSSEALSVSQLAPKPAYDISAALRHVKPCGRTSPHFRESSSASRTGSRVPG